VPPIRSDFPDLGPDPDFFEETSPVFTCSEFMFSDLSSSFLRRSNQTRMTAADIKYLAIPKRSYTNKYLFDSNLKWCV
jgi:hypothetical protein